MQHRPVRRSRLVAILEQRCPRCHEGRPFSGLLTMRETCPVCGLAFEREHGYFSGAMVVSYMLAIPALAGLSGLIWLLTRWPVEGVLAAGDLLFLLLVPGIFRYSRIVWMHFDQTLDPEA